MAELKDFIERIERLEEDKKGIQDDINDIYAEAKGNGFDTKVMRQVLKLRKMADHDRAESEFLREEYKAALGLD